MELKKKTIIWEDNNEPPKDYIWAKKDWKFYEYSRSQRQWVESSILKPQNEEPIESMQVFELNISGSFPQTGTLSTEEIETLSSDNCVLVINNRSYYKSYESEGGMDYLPLGITSVNDGLRTIYFTVDKTTGDYTIAYRYPIQANVQTNGTPSKLENIKVGNTTYSVPLSPMVVEGSLNANNKVFTPASGQPTFNDAREHFSSGGSIIFKIILDDVDPQYDYCAAVELYHVQSDPTVDYIAFFSDGSSCYWRAV